MSLNSNYKLSGRVDGTNADHYDLEIAALLKTSEQSFTINLSEKNGLDNQGPASPKSRSISNPTLRPSEYLIR